MPQQTITIINKFGIHVRVAQKLVEALRPFTAQVTLTKNGKGVDARSILEVLTLYAPEGTKLEVESQGADADQALAAAAEILTAPAEKIIGATRVREKARGKAKGNGH